MLIVSQNNREIASLIVVDHTNLNFNFEWWLMIMLIIRHRSQLGEQKPLQKDFELLFSVFIKANFYRTIARVQYGPAPGEKKK